MTTTRSGVTLMLALGVFRVAALSAQTEQAGRGAPRSDDGGERTASAARILADIKYLADDAREGRGVGTAGLDSSAAYIARQFGRAGLVPVGRNGYFQSFVLDSTAPALAHAGLKPGRVKNVIGVMPGKGKLGGEAIVIGAHYDHLGRGGFGAQDPESTGVVHNGADDNASGTAAVMEIARLLRPRARDAGDVRTIFFVAFTAEELGIIGSSYYVAHPSFPIDSTYAMLNLDMVGRMVDNRLLALGTQTAVELLAVLDTVNADYGLSLAGSGDGWGSSDQAAFTPARIPVLHFFTGIHPDYHRTTDDWQKINVDGEAKVAAFVADIAWKFATRTAPLTYVALPPPRLAAGKGSRAYLGTLPDMGSTPGGVRVSGVTPGSPAEAAGIKGGDVLIRIGRLQIKNLDDMQRALVEHKSGETVEIALKRGADTVTVKATLGKR